MRILILSMPRCGSSSLYHYLCDSLKDEYVNYFEPFSEKRELISCDNLIVKTTINNNILFQENEKINENMDNLYNFFDKIIFLRRSNMKDQKKSYTDYLYKNLLENKIYTKSYEDCKKESDYLLDKWNNVFYKITDEKNMHTYEEIFSLSPTVFFLGLLDYLKLDFNPVAFLKYIHIKNKEKEESWEKINCLI